MVEIAQRGAGLDIGAQCAGIDPHRFHVRQVQRNRALAKGQPADIVAAGAYRQQHAVVPRERYGIHDIGRAGAFDDQRGAPVDHGVPDFSRRLIARLARLQHLASEFRLQTTDQLTRQIGHDAPRDGIPDMGSAAVLAACHKARLDPSPASCRGKGWHGELEGEKRQASEPGGGPNPSSFKVGPGRM